MRMARERGDAERAENNVRSKRENREPMMGYGDGV